MKESIRDRAGELGFDLCRFTTAAPPESAGRYAQWIADGCHGEMGYLARNADRRKDPRLVLPGARSVVLVAVGYGSAADAGSPDGRRRAGATGDHGGRGVCGEVARYARHADYHDVMGTALQALSAHVDAQGGPGTRSLWYVDTGPILERDLAQRGGIGFVGKHTGLISRALGNWFLLGEILTTLELEPDAPERNRCGSCVRCLGACPTGAITEPFRLDARRCISYLTIELKGSIPVELRPAIGTRVFGCDDCLAVCPWNRFAREATLLRAHRRQDLEAPELIGWLSLDEAGFRARFRGTPLYRSKRRGLLRNVCVALGNAGDASALPALERAARDPEPLIAEHAAWAMRRLV